MNIKKLKEGYKAGKMFCERHDLKGKVALDIGCGHGSQTVGFAEHFDLVEGIDIWDKQEITTLAKLSPSSIKIKFRKLDAHQIDILGGNYDLVYSLSTLEHVRDWKQVMTKVPPLLKKGGKFLLVISPLYYSPLGHHLNPEIQEWEHLILPDKELKKKFLKLGGKEWKWDLYTELNKVLPKELIEHAQKLFKIKYLNATISYIEMLCELR